MTHFWGAIMLATAINIRNIAGRETNNEGIVSDTFKNLLVGYDKRIRPNYTGPPLLVELDMYIAGFGSINIRDMTIKLDLFLRQKWHDYRLVHNLSKPINPLLGKRSPPHYIWTPDTHFINALKSMRHKVPLSNERLDIYPDGTVFWGSRLSLTLTCKMDFRKYPMDSQECGVAIESYSYTTKHLYYKWYPDPMEVISRKTPQYTLHEIKNETFDLQYVAGNFSILRGSFTFRRRIASSILHIFFPCTAIVAVSWISLWLHRNCPSARVGLGITPLLTITTIWLSINRQLPKENYIKAVDVYFIGSFLFILLALVEYAVVMNLKFYKRKQKKLRQRKLRRDSSIQSKKAFDDLQNTHYLFSLPLFSGTTFVNRHKKNSAEIDKENPKKMGYDNSGRFIEYADPLKEELHFEDLPRPKIDRNEMPYFYKAYPLIGKPRTIDIICRFLFPFGYICFNIVFWNKYYDPKQQEL